jgi:superfamily II DNA or RNA helicase
MNTDKASIFAVTGGTSELTGQPLETGWHSDHITPRAAGGIDGIENRQATNPYENLQKSCAHVSLRDWQARFLGKFQLHNEADFLLVALPGAGKTVAALGAARDWMQLNPEKRRIIVVVPSDNLREQWKQKAHELFGIELAVKEFTADNAIFKSNFQGACTTYQTIGSSAGIFRALVSRQRYEWMIIMDEIHHAGVFASWGKAIKTAFELAPKRLLMSGTPFRTDRSPIPFVTVDSLGFSRSDFTYDYPEAIRDGVIRVVKFDHYSGEYTETDDITGEEVQKALDPSQDAEEASRNLANLLRADRWQREMMRTANRRLDEVRKDKPDAGGLIIAKDIAHAERLRNIMQSITGEHVGLAVSDEEKTTADISEYSEGTEKWLVSVRQVSEGTDIPRLMILVYLTNICTELFFKQAVGRIVRNQGEDFDSQSFCFIPSHPLLAHYAKNINTAEGQGVDFDPHELTDREKSEDEKKEQRNPSSIDSDSPVHEGTIIDGDIFPPDEARHIEIIASSLKITVYQYMAAVKSDRSRRASFAIPVAPIMKARTKPMADKLAEQKSKAARLVAAVANKTNEEYSFIRNRANERAVSKNEKGTLEYYNAVVSELATMLKNGRAR